jgi:lipoprotein NlpD
MLMLRRLPFSAFATTASLTLALLLAGCGARGLAPVDDRAYGPTPAGFYRVRSGDTLSEIAERKRIKMRQLAAWNELAPPYPLYAGQLLRIKPPKGGSKPSKVVASSKTGASKTSKPASRTSGTKPGSAARASGVAWAWPVNGPIVQSYRANDRTRQGVRIAAPEGSAVAAAADGTVVYSGSSGLAGYGNLIIVKHSPRYLSAYGFNRSVSAREGAKVKRGQQLAEVGRSADGQPMLHFEIRRDGATVDPLLFLPATR